MNIKLKALVILLQFIAVSLLCPIHLSAQQNGAIGVKPATTAEPSHSHYSLGVGKEISLSGIIDETSHTIHYKFTFKDEWSGKQLFVRLSGFNTPFQFHINGFRFGTGEGEQKSVEFNITPFTEPGINRVDLVLSSETPISSDSICRQTTLITRDALHVRDLHITSYSQIGSPGTLIRIHLFLQSYLTKPNKGRTLDIEMSDPAGEVIFHEKKDLDFHLAFRQEIELTFDQIITDPSLWSPRQPNLYKLDLSLYTKGSTDFELVKSSFGIRHIEYQDSLLIINTDSIVPEILNPALIEDFCTLSDNEIIQALKDGKYNVILTSNPLPARLMDLFDRSGIIVLIRKNDPGEEKDRTDINRPSVLWIE